MHGNGITTFPENSFVDLLALQFLYGWLIAKTMFTDYLHPRDISSNSISYLGPNALAMPSKLISLKIMAEPPMTFASSAFGQSVPETMFAFEHMCA